MTKQVKLFKGPRGLGIKGSSEMIKALMKSLGNKHLNPGTLFSY